MRLRAVEVQEYDWCSGGLTQDVEIPGASPARVGIRIHHVSRRTLGGEEDPVCASCQRGTYQFPHRRRDRLQRFRDEIRVFSDVLDDPTGRELEGDGQRAEDRLQDRYRPAEILDDSSHTVDHHVERSPIDRLWPDRGPILCSLDGVKSHGTRTVRVAAVLARSTPGDDRVVAGRHRFDEVEGKTALPGHSRGSQGFSLLVDLRKVPPQAHRRCVERCTGQCCLDPFPVLTRRPHRGRLRPFLRRVPGVSPR